MILLRSILHAILVLLFLVDISGVPVVLHYCCDEVESVRFFATVSSCSDHDEDDCSTDDASSCCHNKVVIQQISFDATSVSPLTLQIYVQKQIGGFIVPPIFSISSVTSLISSAASSCPERVAPSPPYREQSELCIYRC